jgi:hypothetical protein
VDAVRVAAVTIAENVGAENAADEVPTCPHGRDGLAAELRALTLLALDRVEPLLARLRDVAADAAPDGVCPVCAALAAVRGPRPELADRLVEHTAGLLAALRDALAEPGAPTAAEPVGTAQAARPVQHIAVDRRPTGGTPC